MTADDIPHTSGMSNESIHRYTDEAFIEHLVATLNRYESGNFTAEEIHNFCHKLPDTVSIRDFASGCMAYQTQLYGSSPVMDLLRESDAILSKWGIASEHSLRKRIREQVL